MQTVSTIGLDITKSLFQVHGIDAAGQVVIRRQLKRRYLLAFFEKLPPCLIGIEACASSHHCFRSGPQGHRRLARAPPENPGGHRCFASFDRHGGARTRARRFQAAQLKPVERRLAGQPLR